MKLWNKSTTITEHRIPKSRFPKIFISKSYDYSHQQQHHHDDNLKKEVPVPAPEAGPITVKTEPTSSSSFHDNSNNKATTTTTKKKQKKFFRNLFHKKKKATVVAITSGGENNNNNSIDYSSNSSASSTAQTELESSLRSQAHKRKDDIEYNICSPQEYLNNLLQSRGFSTETTPTLSSGYYAQPTLLQQESYSRHLVDIAKNPSKLHKLEAMLQAGISANPCSSRGQSLLHTICRDCPPQTLQTMIDAGSTMQVSDTNGKTPLHEACRRSAPCCFQMAEIIIDGKTASTTTNTPKRSNYTKTNNNYNTSNDEINTSHGHGSNSFDHNHNHHHSPCDYDNTQLFLMTDWRGSTPLSYARREHWDQWIEFLDSKKDLWWGNPFKQHQHNIHHPDLTQLPPNARPVPDPKHALRPGLANMVASNMMTLEEATFLNNNNTNLNVSDLTEEQSQYQQQQEQQQHQNSQDEEEQNENNDDDYDVNENKIDNPNNNDNDNYITGIDEVYELPESAKNEFDEMLNRLTAARGYAMC